MPKSLLTGLLTLLSACAIFAESTHWAYQKPTRTEVSDNPIDHFINTHHQQRTITPAKPAAPDIWLRRVYFDLIGLPPTPTQRLTFLNASQNNGSLARENVINQLLAMPEHGQRWGRHWMDVWRYSDWSGYKNALRGSQRYIWNWRDWIIESVNEDKGYDQMLREMLAGEELTPDDKHVLRATGYLARSYHHSNSNMWLEKTVEHTFKAFLGTTINCAKCHDHKFDPIDQMSYYQARAIFEPHNVRTDPFAGKTTTKEGGIPRAFDAKLEEPTYFYIHGNEKTPDKENPVSPGVPEVMGGDFNIKPVNLSLANWYDALTPERTEANLKSAHNILARAQKAFKEANDDTRPLLQLRWDEATAALASREARTLAEQTKYIEKSTDPGDTINKTAAKLERVHSYKTALRVAYEKETALTQAKASNPEDAAKQKVAVTKATTERDAANKKRDEAKQALDQTNDKYSPIGNVYPQTSTGRRSALARWITSRQHPLTARVAVNHIWLRHIGTPLVDNVFDFGLRSPQPRHHALLDYLAVELMQNNWSMKHLHRLITTSDLYRRTSTDHHARAANALIDPDNHYLWRMNAKRLEAEIVRDSVLHVSQQLDLTHGGTEIAYGDAEISRRRSVYLQTAYEKQSDFMMLFDVASVNECYKRSPSIVPQQALVLFNSAMVLGEARRLATTLSSHPVQDDKEFIHAAYIHLLTRPPTQDETNLCEQFLKLQTKLLSQTDHLTHFTGGPKPMIEPSSDPHQRAREDLVHMLMNHNDFITVR